jgi:hypothetical protein
MIWVSVFLFVLTFTTTVLAMSGTFAALTAPSLFGSRMHRVFVGLGSTLVAGLGLLGCYWFGFDLAGLR